MKYWSPDDQHAAYEGAAATYGALSRLAPDGPTSCWLSLEENHEPGFVLRDIMISDTNRLIIISLVEGPDGFRLVSVSEELK